MMGAKHRHRGKVCKSRRTPSWTQCADITLKERSAKSKGQEVNTPKDWQQALEAARTKRAGLPSRSPTGTCCPFHAI